MAEKPTSINGPMQTPYKDIPKSTKAKAFTRRKPASNRRGGMRK